MFNRLIARFGGLVPTQLFIFPAAPTCPRIPGVAMPLLQVMLKPCSGYWRSYQASH